MRRDKWIKRVKVSLALVAAIALFLVLIPFHAFPYWAKYGWNDIPARGKFDFGDKGLCRVEPYILKGDKLPKGFRPFGYVTVIPDAFPEDRLFGYYNGCGYHPSWECSCAYIPRRYYMKYPNQLWATIIFHPNPYIQALLKVIVGPIPRMWY
jgi:hypothetical protein